MDEFFQRMDRDYDGRLSFEEFLGEESQIEKLFKNMDKNGDGFVTKQVWSYAKCHMLVIWTAILWTENYYKIQISINVIAIDTTN